MSDMMKLIADDLRRQNDLTGVTIKPYHRPESLSMKESSIVIVPMAPPKQTSFGSDQALRKQFTYQFNIEASSKSETTRLALAVERTLIKRGFHQLSGGLDEFFKETGRYVDARRYRGHSQLYDTEY